MMTRHDLEQRLRTGEQMIQSEPNLQRRIQLEEYWLKILKQYETTVDTERARVTQEVFA